MADRVELAGLKAVRKPAVLFPTAHDEPPIHLALATFRSIEHRRWLIRSTATGISAFVDSTGALAQHEHLGLDAVPQGACLVGRAPTRVGDAGQLFRALAQHCRIQPKSHRGQQPDQRQRGQARPHEDPAGPRAGSIRRSPCRRSVEQRLDRADAREQLAVDHHIEVERAGIDLSDRTERTGQPEVGGDRGDLVGPFTFGEIGYQLLNQTLVYLTVR